MAESGWSQGVRQRVMDVIVPFEKRRTPMNPLD
jgi:hypothetical protein